MVLKQTDTPLLAAMLKYIGDGVVPFHTPGHKFGKGMHPILEKIIGQEALALDLALMEELDDFQDPYGCIKEAQELAAELYGAEHSFFVINGTTGGIYAMIMAAVKPGEKIIIPRNAHRSIIGGITLNGAVPVFVQPEVDCRLGIAMAVAPETIQAAMEAHPDAKAVLVINPTYYGAAADLKKITEMVHKRGMLMLVDEAHGPHLRFSPRLPLQAMDAGADACAQSTHKIIGALTQASLVHCQGTQLSLAQLKTMLQLVQSTSPNYLMLASLDVARMQMATEGARLMEEAIDLAEWVRRQINEIPGLYCFGREKAGTPGMYDFDPTKVTVTVTGLGLTGAQAEQILRHRYKVQAELSDIYNVLFLITLGDGRREAEILVKALAGLAAQCRQDSADEKAVRPADGAQETVDIAAAVTGAAFENAMSGGGYPPLPPQRMTPREAVFARTEAVLFAEAAGRVCAELVTVYPPGIPLLCPGEEITSPIIAWCRQLQQGGMHISGPEDGTLTTIKVIE